MRTHMRADELHLIKHSVYAPQTGYTPPEPEWKAMEEFRDALPRRDESSDQG